MSAHRLPKGPWSDYEDETVAASGGQPAEPAQAQDGPWSGYASPNQPIVNDRSGTQQIGGFADELPAQPVSRMAPEDEAHIVDMLHDRATTAQDVRAYAASKGFQFPNAEKVIEARDKTGRVNPDAVYQFPKVQTSGGGAFGRGALQGGSLGFADEVTGLAQGVASAAQGNGFANGYDRSIDDSHALLAADDEDHWGLSLAGNLAGGLVLPAGLEKAGLTTSVRMVGSAARDAAIAAGVEPATADIIASRAIAHRLAAEGAAYGSAQGAGQSDGSPGERFLGAIGGGIVGGVGGALIPSLDRGARRILNAGIGGANAVADAARGLTGAVTSRGATDQAAGVLRGAAIRPISEILDEIASRPVPIAGSEPTLAEVAKDGGIAGMQRGQANTDLVTGPAIGLRQQENALARTRAVTGALDEGVAPQAVQDYAATELARGQAATAEQQATRQAGVDARVAGEQQAAQAGLTSAEQSLSGQREAIGPLVDRTATGSSQRETFSGAYDAAKQRSREAYAAPVLKQPQPIDIPREVFQRVRDAADDFYGDGGGEIPAPLRSIIDDMADPHATTRTLTNIDRRLADFAGEAGMQGRNSEAAFAKRIRGNLNDFVAQAAPQEYRDALANAKAVRAEQGRVFETGDAPRAFANDRFGNAAVGDTTVPSRIVRPGAPGGDTIDGLIAAVGHAPAETAVRQELRRAVEEGAVTTAAQARSLATRFGEVAKRFPAVQQDLAELQSRAAALDTARDASTAASRAQATAAEKAAVSERSALEELIRNSPLGKVADDAVDPSSFVTQLLRRPDDGRQFRVLAAQVRGKPEALSGLRRSLGDYVETAGAGPNFTASGDQVPSINKTRAAIDTVVSRASVALTDQQKIVLKMVGRELEQANFAATASKPAGSETAINRTFQQMMEHVPLVPHRAKSLLGKVFTALSNADEVKRLTTQAILDPDFAATLLKRPTAQHWQRVQRNMLGRSASTLLRSAASPIANAPAERLRASR